VLRGKPAAGPFIQDWLVCGPYTKPGVNGATAIFDVPFGPEKPGEKVSWKPMPRGDSANLAALFPGAENCAGYLKAQIVAPRDCNAALLLGSDDGVKAWLNGALVFSTNCDRGDLPDQDMAPIALKQGTNDLMLKISQGGGGWSAHARIIGLDGQPIPALRVEPQAELQPKPSGNSAAVGNGSGSGLNRRAVSTKGAIDCLPEINLQKRARPTPALRHALARQRDHIRGKVNAEHAVRGVG
jgi:hypothetical protein